MEKYEFSAELYVYLPMSTKYTYLYLPTYVCLTTTIYQPLSTYHHLPTYLPLPILKYQYIFATDPGACIGLV